MWGHGGVEAQAEKITQGAVGLDLWLSLTQGGQSLLMVAHLFESRGFLEQDPALCLR